MNASQCHVKHILAVLYLKDFGSKYHLVPGAVFRKGDALFPELNLRKFLKRLLGRKFITRT